MSSVLPEEVPAKSAASESRYARKPKSPTPYIILLAKLDLQSSFYTLQARPTQETRPNLLGFEGFVRLVGLRFGAFTLGVATLPTKIQTAIASRSPNPLSPNPNLSPKPQTSNPKTLNPKPLNP